MDRRPIKRTVNNNNIPIFRENRPADALLELFIALSMLSMVAGT